jgi:hypothetical protein
LFISSCVHGVNNNWTDIADMSKILITKPVKVSHMSTFYFSCQFLCIFFFIFFSLCFIFCHPEMMKLLLYSVLKWNFPCSWSKSIWIEVAWDAIWYEISSLSHIQQAFFISQRICWGYKMEIMFCVKPILTIPHGEKIQSYLEHWTSRKK